MHESERNLCMYKTGLECCSWCRQSGGRQCLNDRPKRVNQTDQNRSVVRDSFPWSRDTGATAV